MQNTKNQESEKRVVELLFSTPRAWWKSTANGQDVVTSVEIFGSIVHHRVTWGDDYFYVEIYKNIQGVPDFSNSPHEKIFQISKSNPITQPIKELTKSASELPTLDEFILMCGKEVGINVVSPTPTGGRGAAERPFVFRRP